MAHRGCGKTMLLLLLWQSVVKLYQCKGARDFGQVYWWFRANVRDFLPEQQQRAHPYSSMNLKALHHRRCAIRSHRSVVNQLFTFLDGVEDRDDVYVMAATSRPIWLTLRYPEIAGSTNPVL